MIKTFKHKGLEKFYLTGNKSKILQAHARKLSLILVRLEASCQPEDMDLPGFNFHILRGSRKGFYSVTVNGNWRVIFRFMREDAYDVDYLDYH